jgi:hypothetical protein
MIERDETTVIIPASAETQGRSWWVRRIPTLGRTVYWRAIERNPDGELVWSRDYRARKHAEAACRNLAACMRLPPGEGEGAS